MELKEKLFDAIFYNAWDFKPENVVPECEKITNEFAIDFADWLNNGRFSQYGDSWIDPRKNKDKDGGWLFFSSKQLLEIYKKQKGL